MIDQIERKQKHMTEGMKWFIIIIIGIVVLMATGTIVRVVTSKLPDDTMSKGDIDRAKEACNGHLGTFRYDCDSKKPAFICGY